jgi:hypothetical protein
MMKEEKCEKVPLNLLIPKELDREWREYVQKKYGLYRRGILTVALEESLRQFMESDKK